MAASSSLYALLDFVGPIDVIDIGANPIDGDPPYRPLLEFGHARIVGFEPNAAALAKLNAAKGPYETYLPHAIGDGKRHAFHCYHAPGLSSLLRLDEAVTAKFHGFDIWGKLERTEDIDTVRLDDVAEIANADLIKIDIQGGELPALQNATQCLAKAVVVQTEVEFVPLYNGQPLFADIDAFLRAQGFMLHRFGPLISRVMKPLLSGNDVYAGGSQVLETDAIYVKGLFDPAALTDEQLLKTAIILNDCYRSYDAVMDVLLQYDKRRRTSYGVQFGRAMTTGANAGVFRIV